MAIKPSDRYPGQTNAPDANYPQGSAKNITAINTNDGTPWEQDLVNDIFGFQQALLDEAGVLPSGTPDTAPSSQYLQALHDIFYENPTPVTLTSGTMGELINALNALGFVVTGPALGSDIRPNIGNRSNAIEISAGEVTIIDRAGYYRFDTEGLAATDDLDTITDVTAQEGDVIVVSQFDNSRDITFKDATGNLQLAGDFTPGLARGILTLVRAGGTWLELSRSMN